MAAGEWKTQFVKLLYEKDKVVPVDANTVPYSPPILKALGLADVKEDKIQQQDRSTQQQTVDNRKKPQVLLPPLTIKDEIIHWNPSISDLWLLIRSHVLRPYLMNIIKRFGPLGVTFVWATVTIYYCLKHFRRLRDKFMKWLMSLTMASMTIPSSDTSLDKKFTDMLDKKLREELKTSMLSYTQQRFLRVFSFLFSSGSRSMVAQYQKETRRCWQVFVDGGRIFIVTTVSEECDDNEEQEQEQEPPSNPNNHVKHCQCQDCYQWEQDQYENSEYQKQQSQELVYTYGPDKQVWCFGSSPNPVKELLNKLGQSAEEKKMVEVRKYSRGSWGDYESIEPRSMDSIYLNQVEKTELLDDIKEFLDPETEADYKESSIPYHRGYLLYGRPGCGKTSFAQALAALHKLRLNVLSLSASGLNDSILADLFSKISRGDILLIEDIDCASCNINRDAVKVVPKVIAKEEVKIETGSDQDTSSDSESDYDSDLSSDSSVSAQFKGERGKKFAKKLAQQKTKARRKLSKRELELESKRTRTEKDREDRKIESKAKARQARKKVRKDGLEGKEKDKGKDKEVAPPAEPEPQKGVTLGGLLNAIDGVSAPQGHILLLTTNKKDDLDEALIRAGRIDVKAEFSFATTEQAQQLFERLYKRLSTKEQAKYDQKAIVELAKQFAAKVPPGKLSCAQLQGYVLQYRTKPDVAVEKVAEWADGVIKGKVKVAVSRTDLASAPKPARANNDWAAPEVAPKFSRDGW
ncbi:putative mitochondrial chaperone BCS1-A [Cyphellophora attinorum]|uniref:Putative mitochondrial chaperone BCS1-A n=1 Tax=Cyphellophora attinorum TaxID=1664694 RepID=A0A0N1P1E4_9EURO|nr:putative mitochondrial chaperone BCS1-A [Phialophora attinorum]KPI43536.1 putative mitochondrial chaperone BCS1-A [Phialophora attinorum]